MSPPRLLFLLLVFLGCIRGLQTDESVNSPPVTKHDAVPPTVQEKFRHPREAKPARKAKEAEMGQKAELLKLVKQLQDAHKGLKQEVSNTEQKESALVNSTLKTYLTHNDTVAGLKEVVSKLRSKNKRQADALARTRARVAKLRADKAQLKKQVGELTKNNDVKLQECSKQVSALKKTTIQKETQLTKAEEVKMQEAVSQISELNATVSQCQDEKVDLQKTVSQCSSWITQLNDTLQKCTAQNSVISDANAQCKQQNSDLSDAAAQSNSKVSDLAGKAEQEKEKLSQVATKIQELQNAVTQCNKEKTNLQKWQSNGEAVIRKQNGIIQDCNKKGASLTNTLNQCATDHTKLRKELEACQQHVADASAANSQCINHVAALKSQVKERDDALAQTKDQLKEVNINITLRITQCSHEKQEIRKELETCHAVSLYNQVKLLQCMKNNSRLIQLYGAESEIKNWKMEQTMNQWYAVSSQLLNRSKQCEEEKATLQTTATQLLSQNSALVTAVAYCNGEIAEFNRTAMELRAENAVLFKMTSHCANASAQFDFTLKRCQSGSAYLSMSVEKLKKQITALNSAASRKDDALALAKSTTRDVSAENRQLQSTLKNCREKGAKMSRSLGELLLKYAKLQVNAQRLNAEVSELKESSVKVLAENAALKEAVAESKEERTRLSQAVKQCSLEESDLNATISRLRAQNSDLNASVWQCHEDKAELEAEVATLNTRISDLSDSASRLLEKDADLNSTAETCARNNLALRGVIVKLETDNSRLNRSLTQSRRTSSKLEKTVTQCDTEKQNLSNSVQELEREKKNLGGAVAQCKEEKNSLQKRAKQCESQRETLKQKASVCEKERLELNSTFADLQKEYANLVEMEALQGQYVGLGESCSEARKKCSEGLACSANVEGVCVPVCHEVLAPDVVNAKVRWEKAGSLYRGNITCTPDAIYTATDHPYVFCNNGAEKKEWETKMAGHCNKTSWYNFTADSGLEHVLPFTPTVGWTACLDATPVKTVSSNMIHFRTDLLDSKNSTLLRMTVTVDTQHEDGSSHWSTFLSSKCGNDESHKKYAFGDFPVDDEKKISMEIIASSESRFTVKVNGTVHAEYDLPRSLSLTTTNVSKLRLSGDLFVATLNLRCHRDV